MTESLNGKVCVLTGGGGVIGAALAKGLASFGVKIAVLDLNLEKATEVCDAIKETYQVEALPVLANVLQRDSLKGALDQVLSKFGTFHFLINGAGGNAPSATTQAEVLETDMMDSLEDTFFGLDINGFDKVFDLNFKGTLLPCMVFGEYLIRQQEGVILNVSSMNAFRPLTKIPAYSAAKSAVNNFTEWLAVHFAKVNVRVNAIAPGFLLTQQNRFLLVDEKTEELTARGKKIIANTPMGKYGEPEDIVGATAFLLSDASSFITGITIPIDGGFNAYSGV